jgi:1-phosphatidylinositol-4-phosphate 5-kinase
LNSFLAAVPVSGGTLHAPRTPTGTSFSAQTHPPSPQLSNQPHNPHLQPATILEEGESPISFLDQDTTTDRQYFIFYQDEGGLKATDEENKDMSTIYYLGVIDILTPYGAIKKAERWWKCVCVGYIGGIDRVN